MLTIQKTYARAIAGLLTKAFVVKDKMFFALIFLVGFKKALSRKVKSLYVESEAAPYFKEYIKYIKFVKL